MERAAADIAAWRATSDPSRLTIGIAPHAPYSCHPELFRRVAEYAQDGTPVAIHLAGSIEEYQFVKYGSSMLATDVRDSYDADAPAWLPTGVSPVRYVLQWGLFDVPNIMAVHCTQVDDSDIEMLADHDVAIAHCPRCEAKLGMGTAPLEKFLARGHPRGARHRLAGGLQLDGRVRGDAHRAARSREPPSASTTS